MRLFLSVCLATGLIALVGVVGFREDEAAAQDKKEPGKKKRISRHAFKAPGKMKFARGAFRAKGGGVTFGPKKGAPELLTTSSPGSSLKSPTVNVVFHTASWWKDADKRAVVDAVKTILGSSYLSALNQPNYGSDGKAIWGASSTSDAALTLDMDLKDRDGNVIGSYPSQKSLAAFIGPAGKNSITIAVNDVPSSKGAVGVNWPLGTAAFTEEIYVGTIKGRDGAALDMDAFTRVVSHELAEAMVSGVAISDPGMYGGGNQVADGEPEFEGYYANLQGTSYSVQAYWSARERGWVIPGGALRKAPR
jgi:hypothetical protein